MAEEKRKQEEEDQDGISPDEVKRRIEEFEARLASGELAIGSFHLAVQSELYPLLASGDLDETEFTRLVSKWAEKNHPWDWHVRSYLDQA